jgi:hypothetical protein
VGLRDVVPGPFGNARRELPARAGGIGTHGAFRAITR